MVGEVDAKKLPLPPEPLPRRCLHDVRQGWGQREREAWSRVKE